MKNLYITILVLLTLFTFSLPARSDQFDFGAIDPGTTSGTDLAILLGNWRDAINSEHSGTSRPSYATAGTLWLDTTSTTWLLHVYDGSQDIVIGTVNTSSNEFTPYLSGAVLGNMASQAAGSVAISGGSVTGITDLAITDGGTGASTATAGFDNLKQAATESATGVVELATTAECSAGVDTSRACTPAGVATALADRGWTITTVDLAGGGDLVDILTNINSQGYTEIELSCYDFNNSSNTTDMVLELGDGGGYETSGYKGWYEETSGINSGAKPANIMLFDSHDNSDNSSWSARFMRKDVSSNTWYYEARGIEDLTGTPIKLTRTVGRKSTSAATTSIRIRRITTAGQFNSGTIIVKAWKN